MTDFPVEERAGGLVYRQNGTEIEYLLVTSNSNPNRWILPAGHIETGESPEIAAQREVFEEAGVEADIMGKLGELQYFWTHDKTRFLVITSIYLMKFQKTVLNNPEGRHVQFFPYERLMSLNLWEESRAFFKKANRQIAFDSISLHLS
jgi:8-oxo-dGTP pyrophosphatase MutT (NUDIX family)